MVVDRCGQFDGGSRLLWVVVSLFLVIVSRCGWLDGGSGWLCVVVTFF